MLNSIAKKNYNTIGIHDCHNSKLFVLTLLH